MSPFWHTGSMNVIGKIVSMAKDQNTAILQSIVAELRQLNKASKNNIGDKNMIIHKTNIEKADT